MKRISRLLIFNVLILYLVPTIAFGALSTRREMPSLSGPKMWLNRKPSTKEELKGRVILVYFWNSTCSECLRQMPHLYFWHTKYEPEGLTVIAIHSPVYDFEKKNKLVQQVAQRYYMFFPIIHDADLTLWNRFGARERPTAYLIDTRGRIRHVIRKEHLENSEELMIQDLLTESGKQGNLEIKDMARLVDRSKPTTPDVFMGHRKLIGFGNRERPRAGSPQTFTIPGNLDLGRFYLKGDWIFHEDHITLANGPGEIMMGYQGNGLNIISGTDNRSSIPVVAYVNGYPLEVTQRGKDILSDQPDDSRYLAGEHRLYEIANHGDDYSEKLLHLTIETPGLDIYQMSFNPIRELREETLDEQIERRIDELVLPEEVAVQTTISES